LAFKNLVPTGPKTTFQKVESDLGPVNGPKTSFLELF